MSTRVVSVAALCVLLFASPALVGCSSSHRAARSSAGIRLGEPRKRVEKAFGPGRSEQRGLVRYFGGRLLVDYWFHDGLTTRVQGLETRWGGFHTGSGVHVGSSREELRALHMACGNGECSRQARPMPDAPGSIFTMRHGKVAEIDIFYA